MNISDILYLTLGIAIGTFIFHLVLKPVFIYIVLWIEYFIRLKKWRDEVKLGSVWGNEIFKPKKPSSDI